MDELFGNSAYGSGMATYPAGSTNSIDTSGGWASINQQYAAQLPQNNLIANSLVNQEITQNGGVGNFNPYGNLVSGATSGITGTTNTAGTTAATDATTGSNGTGGAQGSVTNPIGYVSDFVSKYGTNFIAIIVGILFCAAGIWGMINYAEP